MFFSVVFDDTLVYSAATDSEVVFESDVCKNIFAIVRVRCNVHGFMNYKMGITLFWIPHARVG